MSVSNRFVFNIVMIILGIALVVMFLNPFVVEGESMLPTLHNGQIVLINRAAVVSHQIHKGDIVIARLSEVNENGYPKLIIKRVIATPGDHVLIQNGQVILNGEVLEESYIASERTPGDINIVLGKHQLFLLGDNRMISRDSRDKSIGPVTLDKLIGRAYMIHIN